MDNEVFNVLSFKVAEVIHLPVGFAAAWSFKTGTVANITEQKN